MNKLAFVLSFALLIPTSTALAESTIGKVDGSLQAEVGHSRSSGDQDDDLVTLTTTTSIEVSDDAATGTEMRNSRGHEDASTTDDTASSTNRMKGSEVSEMHRSAVAAFVKSLLHDADRDGGIGAEVRAVAQSQNDAASTTADAMLKVEGRSKVMSFLFGTDWKHIGTLRSQIAKTDADAARLEAAIARTTDASVKADLEAQLSALTAEQANVKAFVDAHASSFSLFGWFTKLFVSADTSTSTGTTTSSQ
jgi:hypothetical protein